jgi:hypothetical protein
MAFQQPSSIDLLVAIIAGGVGVAAIVKGGVGLGLIILVIAVFGAYATIVEMLEGRS